MKVGGAVLVTGLYNTMGHDDGTVDGSQGKLVASFMIAMTGQWTAVEV